MHYLRFLKWLVMCSGKPSRYRRPGGVCLCCFVGGLLFVYCAGFAAMSTARGTPGGDVAPVVDEPEGSRSNLGGTLWHYRRDPELIREFHTYLKSQGLGPRDLLPQEALQPPAQMTRILIEPEQLTYLPKGAWSIARWPGASNGGGLTAPSGSTGVSLGFPVAVPQAGTYRLWIRFHAFGDNAGIMGLRVYPTGQEEPIPLLNVLANEWRVKESGWRWASYLVDLPAEPVEVRVVHEPAHNEAPGHRSERRLDCIFLTTECWRDAPSLDDLKAVQAAGQPRMTPDTRYLPADQAERLADDFRKAAQKAVRIQEVPFGGTPEQKEAWAWWMARPVDWQLRQQQPELFDVSYRFWRQKVEQLSRETHGTKTDYRKLSRQIIFEDRWNLVGNPVMVAEKVRQIEAAYPPKRWGGGEHAYFWVEAEDFEQIDEHWRIAHRGGNSRSCLRPREPEAAGVASHAVTMDRAGRYAVWVRTGILGNSYSPLNVRVSVEGQQRAARDLMGRGSRSDQGTDWTWQRIGIIKAKAADSLRVSVRTIPKTRIRPDRQAADGAPPRPDRRFFYRWIEAEKMETIAFDWRVRSRSGNSGDRCIGMGVDATGGVGYAAQEVEVDQPGQYFLWIRKGIDGETFSTLRVIMLGPDFGPTTRRTSQKQWGQRWLASVPKYAAWNRRKGVSGKPPPEIGQGTMVWADLDRNDYEPDGSRNRWTWQRIGPLKVDRPGPIRIEVHRRHYPYIYELRALTPEVRRELGPHYFDCFVLTTNPDYRPRGIQKPTGPRLLYLSPAVDCVLVTDNLAFEPRLTEKPTLTRAEYGRRAAALGAGPQYPYLLWVDDPYGDWGWNDWPAQKSGGGRIERVVPRDTVWAAALRLRNLREAPITLDVKCSALRDEHGRDFTGHLTWAVVGRIAPTWAPVPVMRRPIVRVPPLNTASIWLTLDLKGLDPGRYRGSITLSGSGPGAERVEPRRVPVELRVADVGVAPRRPILVGGYGWPFPGLAYKQDLKDHGLNISKMWYLNKMQRKRWGVRALTYPLAEWGPKRDPALRLQNLNYLERMRVFQVDFDEAFWKVGDEPSGYAEVVAYDGRVIREMAPRALVLYNPGPRAGLETFEALDPHTAVWEPSEVHFQYPKRVAIFSAKPYMWYTVRSGSEHDSGLARSMYDQVRSVPARPGNCIGTKFYTLNRSERFTWDTAHQLLPPHEAVFMYPTRHGPVPIRAWEAVRDAGQHANLAVMLKEKAAAAGVSDRFADLVAHGSVPQLLTAIGEISSD